MSRWVRMTVASGGEWRRHQGREYRVYSLGDTWVAATYDVTIDDRTVFVSSSKHANHQQAWAALGFSVPLTWWEELR